MRKTAALALLLSSIPMPIAAAHAMPIPTHFDSVGEDRHAIESVLDTYAKAVSTKNEALFETLLLNRSIPFAGVGPAGPSGSAPEAIERYEGFRASVFGGGPFSQRFQNVHIDQDGPVASVSLVFVNTSPQGSSWGWKTMQLLKTSGQWKIASELYTGHRD